MKANNNRYYKLTFSHNDELHRAGEGIAASDKVVKIGQREDCDILFSNYSEFADEVFAVIKPCVNSEGWTLIPTSDYVTSKVNGTSIKLVHYLQDHDTISFSEYDEQELVFEECENISGGFLGQSLTIANINTSKKIKTAVSFISVLTVALIILTAWTLTYINKERNRTDALVKAGASVLQINIDTVLLVRSIAGKESILEKYSYVANEGAAKTGSAFLTTDSLLFTARHCIEPWLNYNEILQIAQPEKIESTPILWAIQAETYNQTHDGDTIYKLECVCNLYAPLLDDKQTSIRMLSSDFEYENERDEIIELGDFSHVYYWRSISPRHNMFEMMLDDIAYRPFNKAGSIIRAEEENLKKMVKPGSRLDFIGYPRYLYDGQEMTNGEVKRQYKKNEMIAHSGGLIEGYSGGPALVVENKKIYAVGVISVVDNQNGGRSYRSYSVPVVEYKKKGGRR